MRRPPTFHRCQRTLPTRPWLGISITNQALGSTHTGSPDPQALADFISDKYFAGLAWCILSQMYSCKQRLTLFTAAVFCGGRNKLRLFPSISNCWVPYRAPALHTGSHGSQGSPIPETKRSLRVVNMIGRGNATQFLDPQLLYTTSLEPNPPWLIRSLMFTLCNKARRGPNWGLYPNDRLLDEYGALAPWLVDPPLCTLCIQTSSCEKSTVWIRLDVLTLCSLFIQPSSEK